jgi:LmbE family N-acetylglucosaminyl deacetylase
MAYARRRALQDFPLKSLVFLDLPEADVLNCAGWPLPADSPWGIEIQKLRPKNAAESTYIANHYRLREELRPLLAGFDSVVTHNPWGEYGHEEHVQLFHVVRGLAAELGIRVWVSCYVGPKTLEYMKTKLSLLGAPLGPLPVEKELCERLRDLYVSAGCWTWDKAYAWPAQDFFFPVLEKDTPRRSETALPLNMLTNRSIGGGTASRTRRMAFATARRIRRLLAMD